MKRFVGLALVTMILGSGCIVRSRTDRTRYVERNDRRGRACPPAHHQEGGVCVHNGNAKGHRK